MDRRQIVLASFHFSSYHLSLTRTRKTEIFFSKTEYVIYQQEVHPSTILKLCVCVSSKHLPTFLLVTLKLASFTSTQIDRSYRTLVVCLLLLVYSIFSVFLLILIFCFRDIPIFNFSDEVCVGGLVVNYTTGKLS